MEEEIWKTYKDLIQVSNFGRVKSLDRIQEQKNRWGKTMKVLHKGKILKPHLSKKTGYYDFHICNGKSHEYISLHRLIALLFIEIPKELKDIPILKLHVDHINGIKTMENWLKYGNL